MKKILFLLGLLLLPFSVEATNKIYSIDIDVKLNRDGSADVTYDEFVKVAAHKSKDIVLNMLKE